MARTRELKIRITGDAGGGAKALQRTARSAEDAGKGFDQAGASANRASGDLDAAGRSADRAGQAAAGASRDTDRLGSSLDDSAASSRRAGGGTVDLSSNLQTLQGRLRAAGGSGGALGDGLRRGSREAQGLKRSLGGIGNMLSGLGRGLILGQGLLAAAGAAGALAAALAPVLSLAAAIPAALAGIAQVAGTVSLGFMGVGDAVKELGSAHSGAGASAGAGAAQQEAAAERVRSAQMRVADATRSLRRAKESAAESMAAADQRVVDATEALADAEEAAAERVADAKRRVADAARNLERVQRRAAESVQAALDRVGDAERRVGDAQRSAQRAQEDLNDARKDAAERIRDMRRELEDASMTEEDAVLSVQEALLSLHKTQADPSATELERKRADLSYRQAQDRLNDLRRDIGEQKTELAEAQNAGIEGDERVVDAKERVADANRAVTDAMEGLAEAQQEVGDARRDAAESIADAKRALQDAKAAEAKAAQDAAEDIKDAQAQVKAAELEAARARRDANRTVLDAVRALTEAQRDLARASQQTGAAGAGGVNKLAEAMSKLSPAGKRFAQFLNDRILPAVTRLQHAAQEGMLPGVQRGMTAMLGLLPTLEAGIFRTGQAIGRVAEAGGKMLASGPWKRDIATLMDTNVRATENFGMAGLAMADAFRHVAVAGAPMWESISEGALKLAALITNAAAAGRESGVLAGWFERAQAVGSQLWTILKNIGQTLFGVFKNAGGVGQGILDSLERLTTKLNELTNSAEGQQAIKQFFETLERVGPQLGALATNVGRIFAALAKNGGGLEGTVSALVRISDAVARFLEANPAIAGFVAQLGVMAAVAKTLRLGSLVSGILGVARVTGGAVSATSRFVDGLRKVPGAADTTAGRVGLATQRIASTTADKLGQAGRKFADLGVAAGKGAKKVALAGLRIGAAAAGATLRVVGQIAVQIGRWVVLGVQSLIQAGKVALAWLISMGPIALVIAAVVGLVALIVANWDKIKAAIGAGWEWVKRKTAEIWNSGVVMSVRRGVDTVMTFIRSIPGRVRSAFSTLTAIITAPFRQAFDGIRRTWNNTIGGRGFTIPFTNRRFEIPRLASGGLAPGGLAMVGERGPELTTLPRGTRVTPADVTERLMATAGRLATGGGMRAGPAMAMAGGGGTVINIDMSGSFVASGIDFERRVLSAIEAAGRKGAKVNIRGRRL